ncbi:MAG: uracil phosphoribosyltransferase [Capsulimonadaceae bacterium]
MLSINILDHPLAGHYLTHLRSRDTEPARFRRVSRLLTVLLLTEATRRLPLTPHDVETPLEPCSGVALAHGVTAVPILRAGLSMLEPILEYLPDVSVGYIGLERDHTTAVASAYYVKLPPGLATRPTLVLDPMLATGGSACSAIRSVKAAGATDVTMLCVVAAPEGVALVNAEHPDVPVFAAALDRELDVRKYIRPGLGDFGDRLYGTG